MFNIFMSLLIVLNITVIILESVQGLTVEYGTTFQLINTVSVLIFTVEYILRLWTCTLNPAFQRPVAGRLRFAVTPLSIVDILAILPVLPPAPHPGRSQDAAGTSAHAAVTDPQDLAVF